MAVQRVCVFCGSATGNRPVYQQAAVAVGVALAQHGFELVYGGGRVGLMGILADTVLSQGGRAIGIMPAHLVAREIAHQGLSELRVVQSMHERKAAMADLADAFIALPGGYGTLEEFCEMLTWGQLGLHRKACGLLNVEHFYDPLLALFGHAVSEGFVSPAYRALVLDDDDPERLVQRVMTYEPPAFTKWLDPSQT
jgi:uncharacterized protein (TIGR00730 family)